MPVVAVVEKFAKIVLEVQEVLITNRESKKLVEFLREMSEIRIDLEKMSKYNNTDQNISGR